MPWGWAPRQETRAQSHAEPSSTTPWKEQEAQVLKRLLVSDEGRFNTGGFTNNEAKLVYLQKQVQAGVREEAEADLVHGFRAWLQGTHAENKPGRTDKYKNKPDGRPHRRKMDGARYPDEDTDWQSTPWGDAQLTHLPGVREWLREEAIAADKADLEMQLLAEYGPHDVESAWRYYKHWVLKRPISYPHAHAKGADQPGWHGPGMQSDANLSGWNPRRSTHFDALPPPSKPPPTGGEDGGYVPEYGTPEAAYAAIRAERDGTPVEAAAEAAAVVADRAAMDAEAAAEAAAAEVVAAAIANVLREYQVPSTPPQTGARGQSSARRRASPTRRSYELRQNIHGPNRWGWSPPS